jgi:ferredoxin-NADP reductase
MATPKHARVIEAAPVGPTTRRLVLEADEPLGFVGGQYVIVDTGLVAPSGKAVKRAYSIVSADDDQRRLELVVKRLPGGPGSAYLHDLPIGAHVKFSGPWGKLVPGAGASGDTFVLATDTGITAALGLLRGGRFAPLLGATDLVWLRTTPDDFVDDAFVRRRLPAGLRSVMVGTLPPTDHPERVPYVRSLVGRPIAAGRFRQAFVAGDGAVNYALLDDLVAAGIPATRDSVESFFNMPKKSAAL